MTQPYVRVKAATPDVETPLIVIAALFGVVLVSAMLRQCMRRKPRTYHSPLDINNTSHVVAQIGRRKEDLNRFINRLKAQLAFREEQLRYHDTLEEIVTGRLPSGSDVSSSLHETPHQHAEWQQIMETGRQVHGPAFEARQNGNPSLREMMEIHKDELLEFKRNRGANKASRTQNSKKPASRSVKSAQVMALPVVRIRQATKTSDNSTAVSNVTTDDALPWISPRRQGANSSSTSDSTADALAWVSPRATKSLSSSLFGGHKRSEETVVLFPRESFSGESTVTSEPSDAVWSKNRFQTSSSNSSEQRQEEIVLSIDENVSGKTNVNGFLIPKLDFTKLASQSKPAERTTNPHNAFLHRDDENEHEDDSSSNSTSQQTKKIASRRLDRLAKFLKSR